MSQQNARELVIKRYNGSTFDFVCGIRTRSMPISNAQIDTTVPDCTNPSAPISATAMPGRQTLSFTGDGLFDNAQIGKSVADDARTQAITDYQIIVPGYGTFEGPFMVADFEFSGDMEDPLAFSATWVPTESPAFTAAS
ncbi:phage tail tube protein [Ancylobacter polymorphus]|uniref:Phage tail tube protein n=1 Tax=Ancylobacter polymorphus TaxID=223390 RepID=A0A9E6ZX25_9HYPH|nr:phage tail tube protein [Ancylobacter polymorphus]UOK71712.1 phage tail tube protein [Ancylobacter polymorphus]